MKRFQILLTTIFMFASINAFSQSSSELFKNVKEYYEEHSKTGKTVSLDYNRAEKMINYGDVNIPLKDVQILYLEINSSHVVTFNCKDCILSLDEYNRTEYLSGSGIPFDSKSDSYEFINLLADFREKI